MRLSTTTAAAITALCLALAGCSSSGDDGKPEPAASSPSASPTVDKAAAAAACKEGWRKGLEDGSVDNGQIPSECDGVPNSARIGMEALQERNAANRDRLDDCLEDPSCTEWPVESSAP